MVPTDAKRRLSAIVMAGVVGYIRLIQQHEEGTVAAMEACRAICSKQITAVADA